MMKRGLTILTAALFAGALAIPAMAQNADNGASKEPNAAAASATAPDNGATAAKPDEMKPAEKAEEQKPAGEAAAAPSTSDGSSAPNTTSDAGSNPTGGADTGKVQ